MSNKQPPNKSPAQMPDFGMLREVDAVISAFEKAGIRYALAGGFAVAVYGRIRATKDVDFLCHADDLGQAITGLLDAGYKSFAGPRTFRGSSMTLHRYMKPGQEPEFFHVVDILVPPAERQRWITEAEKIPWGQTGKVSVVSRQHLIEMKRLRDSPLDRGDIDFLEGRS